MPTIIAADGTSITLGDGTRRLRKLPPTKGAELDLAHTAVLDLWLDHALGSDYLGMISADHAPHINKAFERAIREANEGEEITLLRVCALAAEESGR